MLISDPGANPREWGGEEWEIASLAGEAWDEPTPVVDVSALLPDYAIAKQDEVRRRVGFEPAAVNGNNGRNIYRRTR